MKKIENVKNNFKEVGSSFRTIAIITIFETFLIIPIFNIISLIYILKALSSLESANDTIQSGDLKEYISKFKTTTILRFIVSLILIPTMASSSLNLFRFRWIFFIPSTTLFLVTLLLRIIAGVIERDAWKSFKIFSINEQNRYSFLHIGQNASDKLENAALCEILSFLLIPILIGWIYRLVGYFELADFEDIPIRKEEKQPKSELIQARSQPSKTAQKSKEERRKKGKFCPYCGDKIRKNATFCTSCGTRLKQKE